MPWNDQDQQNNPWGRRPNQPPPDLDEAIRRLQKRLSGMFGGGGGPSGVNKAMLPVVIVIAAALWLASGIYMVAADENAVVLRFGKYVTTTTPGLNWHLPYPIETVEKVAVTRVQRLQIGFRSMPDGRVRVIPQESLMITKDENIVDISFTVQYRIETIDHFLFNIYNPRRNPGKTVRDAAESAMREVIGRTLIDDVLTTRKAEVEQETQKLIQVILDSYQSGIRITTVKLQDVQPPTAVDKEFKDVQAAREDRERVKNEAQAYANDVIPKSRGEAKKMVLEAEAYRQEIIDNAKGEADRFVSLLKAYREAPGVTRKRLYLETMQHVLSKVDKIIVDKAIAKQILPYLPLDRKRQKVEVK